MNETRRPPRSKRSSPPPGLRLQSTEGRHPLGVAGVSWPERRHPPLETLRYRLAPILLLGLSLMAQGCSVKGMAMNALANSLSGGGAGVYMTDDDPVLVGQALPFSLKLMETILQETPDHEELLVATASAFVMYGHGWVQQPASELPVTEFSLAKAEGARAKKLFLRGRGYAGKALELRYPGILAELKRDPTAGAERFDKEDIPAMYWFAAALGSAISADKNDMDLVADLPVVSALLNRAVELQETWNRGALHELLMVVEASDPSGASPEAVEAHFHRAMELNQGRSIGPLVSLAEGLCVQEQDRDRFTQLLQRALAFDVDEYPETRLANLIAQSHARWLLAEIDEFFFADSAEHHLGAPSPNVSLALHGGLFRWPRQ